MKSGILGALVPHHPTANAEDARYKYGMLLLTKRTLHQY